MTVQTIGKSDLHDIFYVDVTFDAASVTAGTDADQTVTVTGVKAGVDEVIRVIPPLALNYGVTVKNAHVSADDTVILRFSNTTGGNLDPASGNYRFIIGRFGAV